MDEYISREAVLETIRYRVCQGHGNKEHICKRGSCAYCGIMEIMNDISSIEAADVQPVKHGKWENDKLDIPRCSCCSYIPEFNRHIDDYYYSDFCPNCGARMGGGSE